MTRTEDLFFMSGEELCEEMRSLLAVANRETAHQQADEVLCAALRLACSGELSNRQGAAIINYFNELDRWYA